jgi:hypothetical protein
MASSFHQDYLFFLLTTILFSVCSACSLRSGFKATISLDEEISANCVLKRFGK